MAPLLVPFGPAPPAIGPWPKNAQLAAYDQGAIAVWLSAHSNAQDGRSQVAALTLGLLAGPIGPGHARAQTPAPETYAGGFVILAVTGLFLGIILVAAHAQTGSNARNREKNAIYLNVTPANNGTPIIKGWNYMVRLYRARAEILNGKWTFPEAKS